MKSKNYILTSKNLDFINSKSSSPFFYLEIKKINSNFSNLDNFINSFEAYVNSKLLISKPSQMNFQDLVFDSIISRLEFLSKYKNLTIKIYLESQKNNKHFFTLNNHINSYFKKYSNSFGERLLMIGLYALAFNCWIEDDDNLDKTMSLLGKSLEQVKKIEHLFIKK